MNFALRPPKLFQAEYGSFSTDRLMEQGALFPVRVRNRLAICPNGADIEFAAFGHDGRMYYAKGDRAGGPGRFTDALGTRLARHLGIATADHVILEDEDWTDTFFGSHHHSSTATDAKLERFLQHARSNELGGVEPWLGRYLAALYALDLFLSNGDRGLANFVLHSEGVALRLCAIDFGASALIRSRSGAFPVASQPTRRVGKFLRGKHGFSLQSATEMLERISAVPVDTLMSFAAELPTDWSKSDERERLCDFWKGPQLRERLAALQRGLADESLL